MDMNKIIEVIKKTYGVVDAQYYGAGSKEVHVWYNGVSKNIIKKQVDIILSQYLDFPMTICAHDTIHPHSKQI